LSVIFLNEEVQVSYIGFLSLALVGLLSIADICAVPKAIHNRDSLSHLPNTDDTPTRVDFCELVKNPTKYDQKLVAVEAIEVVNTVFVVDGGDKWKRASPGLPLTNPVNKDRPPSALDECFKERL